MYRCDSEDVTQLGDNKVQKWICRLIWPWSYGLFSQFFRLYFVSLCVVVGYKKLHSPYHIQGFHFFISSRDKNKNIDQRNMFPTYLFLE